MSTTSLKLPDDVKQLVSEAADSQGISAHAFMVNAVAQAAENAHKHALFVARAAAARERSIQTNQGYAADEVHAWLRNKVNGAAAARPQPRPWQK